MNHPGNHPAAPHPPPKPRPTRTPQGGAAEGSAEEAALLLPYRQAGAVPKADAAFLQRLMALSEPAER